MNYLVAFILGGTLVTVIVGALLGLLRGFRRSVLRAALIVLCFILALALCGAISDSILGVKISDGKNLEQMLESSMPEGGQAVTDIVVPMAKAFAKIIAFIVVFALLQFITWILVFPILKLVLRPLIGRRPHARLLGMAVGAACGLFVAFAFFSPVNGLLTEVGKIASIDFSSLTQSNAEALPNNETKTIDNSVVGGKSALAYSPVNGLQAVAAAANPSVIKDSNTTGNSNTGTSPDKVLSDAQKMMVEYSNSGISKFYSGVGGGFYRSLSTVKDKNGKKVSVSSQIDALSAVAKLATKAATLKNITNEDGTINTASVKEFAQALTEMDELTPEAKKVLNDMVKSATESFGDDVPEAIKNLDLEKVDFKSEGELLLTAAEVMEKEGNLDDVDMTKLVKDCSKSTIILDTLVESDVTIPVDDEKRAEVDAAIAELESKTGDEAVDENTIAKVKALFGDGKN